MSRLRSPRPRVHRIDLSGCSVESDKPVLAELGWRQGESDRIRVSVEEQQEVIVIDRSASGVELWYGVTVEKHHQAAGESGVPIRLVHLRGVGLEPQDVAKFTPATMGGIASEEPSPPQDWV